VEPRRRGALGRRGRRADPDRWYVSAATGPGTAHAGERARGRLYRWSAAAWEALPLPGTCMPYALVCTDGELLAGMADGQVLRSGDGGDGWEDVGVGLDPIVAMAAA
jgi:hypothetical protein